MSRRRRSSEPEAEENSERWLLTYSDMITLLLALFIILFSISVVNKAKFAELQTDLHNAFNGSQASPKVAPTPSPTTSTPALAAPAHPDPNDLAQIEAQLRSALARAGYINDVEIGRGPDGLSLGFVAGKTFYSVDSAVLSPLGGKVVDVAAGVLARHPNAISINGSTDDQAITGGPYTDNWQLSSARAEVVLERLQSDGVNPVQLYAVALGQYHPAAPNTSPALQAQNRRVDIVVSPPGQKAQLP